MADQLHPTGLDARGALAEGTPEAAEDRRLVQTPLQRRVANLTQSMTGIKPPNRKRGRPRKPPAAAPATPKNTRVTVTPEQRGQIGAFMGGRLWRHCVHSCASCR